MEPQTVYLILVFTMANVFTLAKRKKKLQGSNQGSKRQRESERCILHVSGIEHGDFTTLSEVKGTAPAFLFV